MHSRTLGKFVLLPAIVAMVVLYASPAAAYVGPGLGLSAIGTVLAFVAALFLAIVGFIWYPVRRLIRRARAAPVARGPNVLDAARAVDAHAQARKDDG